MTYYFDKTSAAAADVGKAAASMTIRQRSVALDEIERRLVFDVSVCAACPGFPDDLVDRVNETVLRRSVGGYTVGWAPPYPMTVEEHAAMVVALSEDLHTIFHDLAERQVPDFGDDPTIPVKVLAARTEERREQLAERLKKGRAK
jgi:hypothetical protein